MIVNNGLQPGIYEAGEKVKISESDGFKFLDGNNNEITPQCNIDPASTGIRGYWLQLGSSCVGLHGAAQVGACGKTIDNDKLKEVFDAAAVGIKVTVKDPYQIDATYTSQDNSNQAAATSKSAAVSSGCGSVCSYIGSSLANWLGFIDCNKRCSQLGCYWENGRCEPHSSLCL